MRRITIIDGHPDPSEARLNHALADRYAYAARAAGNEVRRVTIAQLHVPILRNADDFYTRNAPDSLHDAQIDIAWADHLVFLYPLWHGTMPALLKAFIEQTFRPGYAMEYQGRNRLPKQLFKGKSARVIVTMGMPALVYRTYFGAYGVKSFVRNTLALCGVGPIEATLLGMAGGPSTVRGATWLELMDVLAQADSSLQRSRARRLVRSAARAITLLAVSYAAFLIAASAGQRWYRTPGGGKEVPASITIEEEVLVSEQL